MGNSVRWLAWSGIPGSSEGALQHSGRVGRTVRFLGNYTSGALTAESRPATRSGSGI